MISLFVPTLYFDTSFSSVYRGEVGNADKECRYKKSLERCLSRDFCELGGSRTHNLLGRNQVLYPLSYESLFILRGKGRECSLFMQEFRAFFSNTFFYV